LVQVVVLPQLLLEVLVAPLPELTQLMLQLRKKRKKRVRQNTHLLRYKTNNIAEKEESDDDMGFGLFD
jgi:hypothetical protein